MSFLIDIVDNLEDVLANSETFRTWCGAATAAAAKSGYIFGFDSTTESGKPNNYAVIPDDEDWQYSRDAEGSGVGIAGYSRAELIEIQFFESLSAASKAQWTEANARAFLTFIGNMVLEIINTAGTYGVRISVIQKVPFSNEYQLRAVDDDTGYAGYQYRIRITTRT